MLKMARYSTPIDMWSVGCIFAEMLRMLDTEASGRRRKALFPGKSSWNMTPPKGSLGGSGPSSNGEGSNPGSRDQAEPFHSEGQLMTIINIIGTPTAEERGKVEDPEARRHLETLPPRKKQELGTILPHAGPDAFDLLEKMLKFDPDARASVDDAIEHPYFAGCFTDQATYGDMKLRVETIAERVVELDFDNEVEGTVLTSHDLKVLMCKEIKKFHKINESGLPSNATRSPVRLGKREGDKLTSKPSPAKKARAEI